MQARYRKQILIEITKWIKNHFIDAKDFEAFLEYLRTVTINETDSSFPIINNLPKYNDLYTSIKHTPEFIHIERMGKEIHQTKRTVVSYLLYRFAREIHQREKLFSAQI